jgi:hypothetical protein
MKVNANYNWVKEWLWQRDFVFPLSYVVWTCPDFLVVGEGMGGGKGGTKVKYLLFFTFQVDRNEKKM